MSKNRDFFSLFYVGKKRHRGSFFSIVGKRQFFSLNLTFQAHFHPGDNL